MPPPGQVMGNLFPSTVPHGFIVPRPALRLLLARASGMGLAREESQHDLDCDSHPVCRYPSTEFSRHPADTFMAIGWLWLDVSFVCVFINLGADGPSRSFRPGDETVLDRGFGNDLLWHLTLSSGNFRHPFTDAARTRTRTNNLERLRNHSAGFGYQYGSCQALVGIFREAHRTLESRFPVLSGALLIGCDFPAARYYCAQLIPRGG